MVVLCDYDYIYRLYIAFSIVYNWMDECFIVLKRRKWGGEMLSRELFSYSNSKDLSINSFIIFLKTKIKWNVLPLKIPTTVLSKLSGLVVSLTILYIWWSRLYYWKYFLVSRENPEKTIWSSVSHHQLVFISVYPRDFTGCDLTETWVLVEMSHFNEQDVIGRVM